MIKTASIDRSQDFSCPKPAGGAKLAFALTAIFHAALLGALAAIGIHLVPTSEDGAEIEASFTAPPPASIDLATLERSVKQPAELSAAATELQLRELPFSPTKIDIPVIIQAPIEQEHPTFVRDLIPQKEKPKTKASKPPTKKKAVAPAKKSVRPPIPKPKPAVFKQASVRSTARPAYPDSARRKGQQGTANVRLTLNSNGKVTAAALSKSSGHAALDKAAVKAAKRWKFKPATSGGKPVATKIDVPITFRLK